MPDPDLLPRLREAGRAMDLNMDWPLFEQAANEIAWLRNAHQTMTDAFRDEMDENLRLRDLGGALPDENITAMTERVIRERDEWREMALSQAGDAGLLTRAMKAETEAALLRGEVDRLTEELDSANLARMVADVVKRDAYRYRKLLMHEKHWLGVFCCDPDGTPSDSISNDELSALLDSMDGPEALPEIQAP